MYQKTIQNQNFNSIKLEARIIESCTFKNCSFSAAKLDEICFEDCTFLQCDFSNASIRRLTLNNCEINNSKLIGLHFQQCNPLNFEVYFKSCNLDLASFSEMNLTSCKFSECQLTNVDFYKANLEKNCFDKCDFKGAIFEKTNLKGCDMRTAYNFIIRPTDNNIINAKFGLSQIQGLLEEWTIEIDSKY